VNQRCPNGAAGPRQRQHAERVHAQRAFRIALRPIDIVVRRTVDDHVGPDATDGLLHRLVVGDIEVPMIGRMDVRRALEPMHDRDAKQTGSASDQHPHQTSACSSASTTERCCISVRPG